MPKYALAALLAAIAFAVCARADNLIIGSGNGSIPGKCGCDCGCASGNPADFTFERRSDTGALVLSGSLAVGRDNPEFPSSQEVRDISRVRGWMAVFRSP